MTASTAAGRRRVAWSRDGATLPLFLAGAAVASTATKLRFAPMSFGVGEALLVAWLGTSIIARATSTGFYWQAGSAVRWGGPFLLCTLAALLCGALAGQVMGMPVLYDTRHEALAWVFVLGLVGWFVLEAGATLDVRGFLRWFAAIGALSATLLLASAVFSRIAWGSDALWYAGVRLSGWSENPNQLALLLAPLPFLAIEFRREATSGAGAWTAGIVATAAAGLATLSDALLLSWGLGAMTLLAARWVTGILGARRTVGSIMLNAVAVPATLVLGGVLIGGFIANLLEAVMDARISAGGQASTRMTLWQYGLQAAFESPLFGWGPGAHSGFEGPFEGVESHSTFIDLATQAGLPAALALLALILLGIARALRRKALPLALALLSVAVVATFHNVLRQPIFWLIIFGVIASVDAGDRRVERTVSAGRQPTGSV